MRCGVYCGLITSAIGVILGFSAHITFTYVIKNEGAGAFALISGIFAAVCFHINYLFYKNKLETYHSFETIDNLHGLGFIAFLAGFIAMCWYIFSAIYWKDEIVDLARSPVVSAVWAFMTAKWGIILMGTSSRYTKIIRQNHALIQSF